MFGREELLAALNGAVNLFCALPPWPTAILCLSFFSALFRYLLERKANTSEIDSKR